MASLAYIAVTVGMLQSNPPTAGRKTLTVGSHHYLQTPVSLATAARWPCLQLIPYAYPLHLKTARLGLRPQFHPLPAVL
jgi:hypothetical protein